MPPSKSSIEKRLFRTRSKCPKTVQENMDRAKTQSFSVMKIPPLPTKWTRMAKYCQPTMERSEMAWDVQVLGSTGNVYTVTLDYRPICNCPNFAKKEDVCKHLFFVLLKVVGLSQYSPIIFQKSYLTTELLEIYTLLEVKTSSKSVKIKTTPNKVRAEYERRVSGPSKKASSPCYECGKRLKSSHQTIHCPNSRCLSAFHAECLVLPDMDRLSMRAPSKKVRTVLIECPCCDTFFEHDEGYVNMADVTGQSRIRDKSSYRPCPGYY